MPYYRISSVQTGYFIFSDGSEKAGEQVKTVPPTELDPATTVRIIITNSILITNVDGWQVVTVENKVVDESHGYVKGKAGFYVGVQSVDPWSSSILNQ